MKVCCISDLHGQLPPTVPECDLLLIAGDITPHVGPYLARQWLDTTFRDWMLAQPVSFVLMTWGNHDWIGQRLSPPPWMRFHLLVDAAHIIGPDRVKVYGSPWQPIFFDWAFNLPEDELAKKWAAIPDDTNILLLHGPPHGYGDLTTDGTHTGSPSLTARIREVRPKLVVCGHIHESHGVYDLDGIPVVNASLLDERYRMVNKPVVVEI